MLITKMNYGHFAYWTPHYGHRKNSHPAILTAAVSIVIISVA